MKLLSKILMFVAAIALFSSCDGLNEAPEFSDSNAFVAFSSKTIGVKETATSLSIPVSLVSLKGIENDVYYTVKSNTAQEGEHFTINGNKSLSFSKDATTANIEVQIIDNDEFEGDISFTIELSDPGSVDLGAMSSIVVTIEDDEHPLAAILGAFTARGTSYFNGASEWTVTIVKDADDLSKVWISNLVVDGTSVAVYGVVNAEKTELRIPVYQTIATSSSYPQILLMGFYGPDGAVAIPDGGYIAVEIDSETGTMSIMDEFGSQVFNAAGAAAGWYNIFAADVVLTKN